MLSFRTILHPTDFSERSDSAFWLACSLARDCGARLVVLHVVQPPPFVTHGEMEKALQQARGYRQELKDKLKALRTAAPGLSVECRLEDGEPVAAIFRAARDSRCDLIVMGTHGRTGFCRLLLGSVAEGIIRRAPCPVLTMSMPPVGISMLRGGAVDR
jgi:nucleotide-binding universal stress UspA family protein